MADFKQNMGRHLSSARQWLTRAEEAFAKDRDIRAELNLMLAQAELQHVKEANRAGRWRFKYPFLRHSLALGLALMVVVAGFGGAVLVNYPRHVRETVPLAAQSADRPVPPAEPAAATVSSPPVAPAAGPLETVKPAPRKAEAAASPAVTTAAPVSQVTTAERPQPESNADLLSPDEMQKLVRAAGKSLRGGN